MIPKGMIWLIRIVWLVVVVRQWLRKVVTLGAMHSWKCEVVLVCDDMYDGKSLSAMHHSR